MSWSTSLEIDTGNEELAEVGSYEDNCTFNLSPMFFHAFRTVGAGDEGFRGLTGKACSEIAELLPSVIAQLKNHPEIYKPMNPENGWGDYNGAIVFLERLLAASRNHPKAQLGVSG